MKSHKRTFDVIGGFVVIILLAAFFAVQNYSNIGVQDSPKVTTSKKSKPAETKKNKSESSKKSAKSDQNIFLQDENDPDRVIAIHPYGSNGVYQYRSQANGSIYPEYKLFNGTVSTSGDKISVTPLGNKQNNAGFTFKKDKSGVYHEAGSGQTYQPITIKPANPSNKPTNVPTPQTPPNGGQTLVGEDPYTGVIKYILDNSSNPTQDASSTVNKGGQFHSFFPFKNGAYFDFINKIFYGPNSENMTMTDLRDNPSEYFDGDVMTQLQNNVMYYRQNNTTTVTNDDVQENIDWNKAMSEHDVNPYDNQGNLVNLVDPNNQTNQ
jgi:hypothetical protein